MENIDNEFRKIAFLADLHKDIDSLEDIEKEKVSELKQKFYDLATFKEKNLVQNNDEEKQEANVNKALGTSDSSEQNSRKVNRIHNPYQVSPFLHAFCATEPLKFLTHNWDENLPPFNYIRFIEEARRQFDDLIKKFPNLPPGLVAKIRLFAFIKEFKNNQGWSEEKIQIGWSSPIISDYLVKNTGFSPLSAKKLEFNPPLKSKAGSNYRYFNDLAKKFKSEIEFRSDLDNDLETIIRLIITKLSTIPDFAQLMNFILNFDGVQKGISLYTDIEKIKQAIRYILKAIPSETPNKELDFSFTDSNDSKEVKLIIIHKDSAITKSFGSFKEKIRNESGDTLGKVPGLLRSLCDWKIITKFGDEGKFGEYSILPEGDLIELPVEQYEGVKHVLTFYRSE